MFFPIVRKQLPRTQTLAATDRLLAPEGPPPPPPQVPPTAAAIGWVRGVWASARQQWQQCQALGQAALASSAGMQVGDVVLMVGTHPAQ